MMNFRPILCACTILACGLSALVPARGAPASAGGTSRPVHCTQSPPVAGRPWTLVYGFGGGLPMPGQGSVRLRLDSRGKAVITTTPYRMPPRTRTVTIPPAAMAKIAHTLHASPPACMHTTLRKGYMVFDMGAYTLRFTQGGHSISAHVDGCHYVDRGGPVFEAIVDAIQALKPYLGPAITWSSVAASSVRSDACARHKNGP